jgi:aspartyl-tRNA(Asn)/glutamyl-tRNA(Gln) amidotransferase subunit C
MAVTRDDVKHVANLARLGLSDARADTLVSELNAILGHMDALSRVDTARIEPVVGVGAESPPLQEDEGPSVSLERDLTAIAPSMRDGFFLVPRLSTHETAAEG